MNMIGRLRTTARQYVFAPVHELAPLSRGAGARRDGVDRPTPALQSKLASLRSSGGEVAGEEWAHHIVHHRRGITLRGGLILKSDLWPAQFKQAQKEARGSQSGQAEGEGGEEEVRGAINFRRVPGTSLFGLSQPTEEGIDNAVETARKAAKKVTDKVTWINLRSAFPIRFR